MQTAVAAALGLHGALARSHPGMRLRPGQVDMAAAVTHAIEAREHLVVEAGTGIGKTWAYLVPVLLSGRRALLSTATQALQEQLFLRDIPAVAQALGLPVRVALLKGRSSYVCLQRLDQARQGGRGVWRDPALGAALDQVQRWALQSLRGDLSELSGLDEASPLRPLVSSTRENCLGQGCPFLAACHVKRARSEALQADWAVINHHLLLSEHPLQEGGSPGLLAGAEVLVVDEAHQLRDMALQHSAQAIGDAELRDLARDIAACGPLRARGLQPWAHLALLLEQAAGAVSRLFPQSGGQQRMRWGDEAPQGLELRQWAAAVALVRTALDTARQALALTVDAALELAQLHQQACRLLDTWRQLTQPGLTVQLGLDRGLPAPAVRWLDGGSGAADPAGQARFRPWRLVGAPLDSAAWLGALMNLPASQRRSWVFTSATLGTDARLSWFTRALGLDSLPGLRTLRLPSPFDHEAQAALYIPEELPEPLLPGHTPALAVAVARWATRLGGRTLVLTTTLKAARVMAHELKQLLAQPSGASLEVLDAGSHSRRALLARFREVALQPQHPGAVLVASMSFWEGVDLAGEVLQLLVIDKLPFTPPDDPLIHARSQACIAAGQRAFEGVHLPEAAVALKQGAGRLIRSESDRGILVLADRRLLTRTYAAALLEALPPMRRLVDEADMASALDVLVLTRPSTTGPWHS